MRFSARMLAKMVDNTSRAVSREVEIPVPYGVIAGKEWGNPNGTPLLGVHGWLDNSGTFDHLAPLLPLDKFRFVCIDVPGYGRSSHRPQGTLNTSVDNVHAIQRVVRHLNWSRYNYIGHSMGASLGVLNAAFFPQQVDKLVLIDWLKPVSFPADNFTERAASAIEAAFSVEEKQKRGPPSYTWTDIRDKQVALGTMLPRSMETLMRRGVRRLSAEEMRQEERRGVRSESEMQQEEERSGVRRRSESEMRQEERGQGVRRRSAGEERRGVRRRSADERRRGEGSHGGGTTGETGKSDINERIVDVNIVYLEMQRKKQSEHATGDVVKPADSVAVSARDSAGVYLQEHCAERGVSETGESVKAAAGVTVGPIEGFKAADRDAAGGDDRERYVFSRDLRTQLVPPYLLSHEYVQNCLALVKCSVLFVKASDGLTVESQEYRDGTAKAAELIRASAASFEEVELPGKHHVHLDDPERVAPVVNRFLLG